MQLALPSVTGHDWPVIKLIADYNDEIEMLKPVRKHYATKGDICFHVADTRIAAFERVVSDLEKAISNCV